MAASSRDELETRLSGRADALSAIELTIDRIVEVQDLAIAEWHVSAQRDRPFVIAEDTALDSPGQQLELVGATSADFAGTRICAIRHYFDKVALLAQLRPS